MKRTQGILIFAILGLMILSLQAFAAAPDYVIYSAEDLDSITESMGMKTEIKSDSDSTFIHCTLSDTNKSDAWLRFNFFPYNADPATYVSQIKAKDYPIVVVSCKSNIINSTSTLAANAGLKITSTNAYERCWGLNSTSVFGTLESSEKLQKVYLDLSHFNGIEATTDSAKTWEDVDENSVLKYLRIPAWNKRTDEANFRNEYFDVEYVGIFKNVEDAQAFDYEDYRKCSVVFKNIDGEVIYSQTVKSGTTINPPSHSKISGKMFNGWQNQSTSEKHYGPLKVSMDMVLTATYTDYILIMPNELDMIASSSLIECESMKVNEDGETYIRFSVPEGGMKYEYNTFGVFYLEQEILAHEYPVCVLGYKSNITSSTSWGISVGMKSSGKYSRFWGMYPPQNGNGKLQKAISDVRAVTGGDAGVKFDSVDSDSLIKYVRFAPWGTRFGMTLSEYETLDICYLAFFKDNDSASNFDFYTEVETNEVSNYHQPFMKYDEDFNFRPDDMLTQAEAAYALSKLLIDERIIAGKYESSFSDISKADWFYDEVAYLQRRGYIQNGKNFEPDRNITKGELAQLLELVHEKEGINCSYPGSYTATESIPRWNAAEVLCNAFGRKPTAEGIKYKATGYFNDVSKDSNIYPYVMEATYAHSFECKDNNTEAWITSTDNNFYLKKTNSSYIDELDALFEKRKNEVINTKSEWSVGSGGSVFYVSSSGNDSNSGLSQAKPLKTLTKVMALQNNGTIGNGDVVLLKRGDEWHTKFTCASGVTYSAYGEGKKPRVLGSTEADKPSQWTNVGENLYKFTGTLNGPTSSVSDDVGNIVFNNGEYYGQRVVKSLLKDVTIEAGDNFVVSNGKDFWSMPIQEFHDQNDLIRIANSSPNADLMFYHNWSDKSLYLYCKNGNPGNRFNSIELCTRGNAVNAKSNNTIDNWCVLYSGSHGIGAGTTHDLTVRNCEVGWIGGSVQFSSGTGEIVRYGNGIEIYGSANGYYVYNNYIYQCFDCGPTVQWGGSLSSGQATVQEKVEIRDNVLWDADLEVWLTVPTSNSSTVYSGLKNCRLYNNLVTASGYGFGGYNNPKHEYCCFYGAGQTQSEHIECYVEDNIFWNIRKHLWKAVPTSTDGKKGFHWRNNTIILNYGESLGFLAANPKDATGGLTKYLYTNDRIRRLVQDNCLGANKYLYLLKDGQTDPYQTHLEYLEKTQQIVWTDISSASDLTGMNKNGNYRLTSNIDMADWSVLPVGTKSKPFTGKFDGNGYKISNLNFISDSEMSLFGACSGAEIKNLTITNSKIDMKSDKEEVYVAFICSVADNKTTIENCSVNGSITADVSGNIYAAGICAYNDSAIITDCESAVKVNVQSDETAYISGICSYLYSDGKLVNCENRAVIAGEAQTLYSNGIAACSKESTENPLLVPEIINCTDLGDAFYGDVNGDGDITSLDSVILSRYLAKWNGYSDMAKLSNSDVNGDGDVTSLDSIILARHIAKWKGYAQLPYIG